MKLSKYAIFLVVFSFFSCGNDDVSTTDVDTNPISDNNNTPNLLLQLSGTQIVDASKAPVYLEGVAFGNEIWSNSLLPPVTHHSEIDYKRVKDMGMNAIRFYLNYRTFEDDSNPYQYKQTGWDWLDKNIEWAKKHGIYLILNMHAPQGGYQSQGEGDALWNSVENQNRLAALWKAIAERYKDEVQIAGFGPVNEPVPTVSIDQWSQLAQKLINEIRGVDKNHLIFIERAIYVKGNFTEDENLNYPNVQGENLIYEFHGYEPFLYTHQLMEFSGLGDGGKYPDESIIEVSNSEWYTATFDNPALSEGNNDWQYFEGNRYKVTDDKIVFGLPALVGAAVNGKVYFDDIIIKEYDENGVFKRNILEMNLNSIEGWNYWSSNGSGFGKRTTTVGHNDTESLLIENATGDCNLSNSSESFIPTLNYSYEISGWMRGKNVSGTANCKLRIDFYTSEGPVLRRNKEYLEFILDKQVKWAERKNVALYMGEFGAGYPSFQNGKGGLQFVEDMVSIAKEKNIHFTYHTYHEDNFGLYLGYGSLPDPSNVNQPLIDLFTTILN